VMVVAVMLANLIFFTDLFSEEELAKDAQPWAPFYTDEQDPAPYEPVAAHMCPTFIM